MKSLRTKDGKLILTRDPDERQPIVQRLKRIEGQVRGLIAMIEDDRYCGDELQQIKAAIAGMRKVGIMIAEQHIAAGASYLSKSSAGTQDIINKDIMAVLHEVLKM